MKGKLLHSKSLAFEILFSMFFVNILILRNLSQICVNLIFTIQKYIIFKNENDKSIKHEKVLHLPLLNTPLLVTHQKGYLYELELIETKM